MIQSDPGLNSLDWALRASLVQNGFTEETVDSPVGRQTCFTAGTGAPLVFLHGAGDHAGSWAGVAPQF
ncbi:MAG TPA: hypothetical protein VMQ11_16795, partial [Alphaproteobacteria bacterium]|nr:hypothetical protein [Candidatus Acidoferrales bacterium]HTP84612.1 hypothetical protein [Alphaproteobacteria bacterium]